MLSSTSWSRTGNLGDLRGRRQLAVGWPAAGPCLRRAPRSLTRSWPSCSVSSPAQVNLSASHPKADGVRVRLPRGRQTAPVGFDPASASMALSRSVSAYRKSAIPRWATWSRSALFQLAGSGFPQDFDEDPASTFACGEGARGREDDSHRGAPAGGPASPSRHLCRGRARAERPPARRGLWRGSEARDAGGPGAVGAGSRLRRN